MNLLNDLALASISIFNEAALYILLGLAIAGMIRVYVRPESISHYFYKGKFRSVLYAALFGVPLPL